MRPEAKENNQSPQFRNKYCITDITQHPQVGCVITGSTICQEVKNKHNTAEEQKTCGAPKKTAKCSKIILPSKICHPQPKIITMKSSCSQNKIVWTSLNYPSQVLATLCCFHHLTLLDLGGSEKDAPSAQPQHAGNVL